MISGDKVIQKVKEDFSFLMDRCFAVLIFGSYARNEEKYYSDIDVCIVLKNRKINRGILYEDIYQNVRMDIYDVVIFEGCSDDLKYDISKDHIIVYCKNPEELKQYLKPSPGYIPVKKTREELLNELRSVVNAV